MEHDVKFPIETVLEGDTITKTCVEDVYKISNRIIDAYNKFTTNFDELIDSVHCVHNGIEGELIFGRGVSKPCDGDKFNEEIGNKIAFQKMKLNANIKKWNWIHKIYNENVNFMNVLEREMNKIQFYIDFDIYGIREFNPNYLKKDKKDENKA